MSGEPVYNVTQALEYIKEKHNHEVSQLNAVDTELLEVHRTLMHPIKDYRNKGGRPPYNRVEVIQWLSKEVSEGTRTERNLSHTVDVLENQLNEVDKALAKWEFPCLMDRHTKIQAIINAANNNSECFQRDHAGRIADFEARFKEIDEVLGRPELAEWRRIDTLKDKMKSLERLSEDVAMYEKWFEEFDKEVGIVRHDGNRMKVAVDLKKERDSLQATVDMAVQAGVLVKHEGAQMQSPLGKGTTKVPAGYMVVTPIKSVDYDHSAALQDATMEELVDELKRRVS